MDGFLEWDLDYLNTQEDLQFVGKDGNQQFSENPSIAVNRNSNRIQQEFTEFWETAQIPDGGDGISRCFDHSCSIAELLEKYNVEDISKGLSEQAVEKNALLQTQNENTRKEPNFVYRHWLRIRRYFLNYRFALTVACVMFFDGFLSNTSRPTPIVIIVILIIVFLSVTWFPLENKGDILRRKAKKRGRQQRCFVIRNGEEIEVDVRSIVVGDLLVLKAGSDVPVDGRVVQIKAKPLKSSMTRIAGNARSERVLTTACTNQVDWRSSRNIVLQEMQIITGEAVIMALNTSDMSTSTCAIQQTDEIQILLRRKGRRTAGGQIRYYIAACSVVGMVMASVLGIIAQFVLGLSSLIVFPIVGWVLVAFVPIGLVMVVSIGKCANRKKRSREMSKEQQDVRSLDEFPELLDQQSVFCADLSVLGQLVPSEVNQVWVNRRVLDIEGNEHAMNAKLKRGLMRIHACFKETMNLYNEQKLSKQGYLDYAIGELFNTFYDDNEEGGSETKQAIAVITEHRNLSFVMRVVEEPTRFGNAVAYIRGDPQKILEICNGVEDSGTVREMNKQVREYVQRAIRTMTKNTENRYQPQNRKQSLAKRKSNAVNQQNQSSSENIVVAFARKELFGNFEVGQKTNATNGVLFNGWGQVSFAFSEFQLIGLVALSQRVKVAVNHQSVGDDSKLKLVYFSNLSDADSRVVVSKSMRRKNVKFIGKDAKLDLENQEDIVIVRGLSGIDKIDVVERLRQEGHIVGCLVEGIDQIEEFGKAANVRIGIDGDLLGVEWTVDDQQANGDNKRKSEAKSRPQKQSRLFTTIERGVAENMQDHENIRKVLMYFAAVKSAEIAAVLAYFIFGFPMPLSPLLMVLLTCCVNVLPGVSLMLERDSVEVMKEIGITHSSVVVKGNRFHVVSRKLVFYAHVVLGVLVAAGGLTCYMIVMDAFGFSLDSIVGLARCSGVVPNLNYQLDILESSVGEQFDINSTQMTASYDYPSVDEAGVIINEYSPYWSYEYMEEEERNCVENTKKFNPDVRLIDWTGEKDRDVNLRKRLNVCDQETKQWKTAVEWSYCQTGESLTSDSLSSVVCYSPNGLVYAQSAYFAGLVWVSIGSLFAVKSLRRSSFTTGFNWLMILGVVVQVGLAVLITAVPGITWLFDTGSVKVMLWGFPATIFLVVVFLHEECRKMLSRKSKWLRGVTDF